MSSSKADQREHKPVKCKACGEPEKLIAYGLYTTIAPSLGICVDCINKGVEIEL